MAGWVGVMLCFWNPNQPILEGTSSQALGRLCKEIRTVVLVRVAKGSSGILAPTVAMTRGRTQEQGGTYCTSNQFHFRVCLSWSWGNSLVSCTWGRDNPLASNPRAGTSCLCSVLGVRCPRHQGAALWYSREGWGQFGTITDHNSRVAVLPWVVSTVSAHTSVLCTKRGWECKKELGKATFPHWHTKLLRNSCHGSGVSAAIQMPLFLCSVFV